MSGYKIWSEREKKEKNKTKKTLHKKIKSIQKLYNKNKTNKNYIMIFYSKKKREVILNILNKNKNK